MKLKLVETIAIVICDTCIYIVEFNASVIKRIGCHFNIKITSYQQRNSHYEDKMVSWPSYLLSWQCPYLEGWFSYILPDSDWPRLRLACWGRSFMVKSRGCKPSWSRVDSGAPCWEMNSIHSLIHTENQNLSQLHCCENGISLTISFQTIEEKVTKKNSIILISYTHGAVGEMWYDIDFKLPNTLCITFIIYHTFPTSLNLLKPSDAYMPWWTWPSLAEAMAWCLFSRVGVNSGVGVGVGFNSNSNSGVGVGIGVETSGVGVGIGVDILEIGRSWSWSWSWNSWSWSWSWSWYSRDLPELELELELKLPELELELELKLSGVGIGVEILSSFFIYTYIKVLFETYNFETVPIILCLLAR